MAPEFLFGLVVFLLPIAAFSGWYYGRKSLSPNVNNAGAGRDLSQDYFRGLNYLLDDRPDKAIEVFVKVLEVDSETVETHLALGNLFRRRGEVDRAIRIHQNLIARPTLSADQHSLALLELGLDYMRSGLLDRAENIFKELLPNPVHEKQVLRHLVDIYQQEQDWDEALISIKKLERAGGEDLGDVRAHFYCEKAQQRVDEGDRVGAFEMLDRALKEDKNCVRARLLFADWLLAKGEAKTAIKHLKKIPQQNLEFLAEAIPRLFTAYRMLDEMDELTDYLQQLAKLHAGISPVLMLAQLTAERRGLPAAKAQIIDEIAVRPTIRGIDRLLEYALVDADEETRADLEIIKRTTAHLISDRPSYQCGSCGFTGRSLHWQCPSCKSWNTVKSIHGIEGE